MLNNSNPGQLVYDPFLGSGTTLIAAETTGRICLGVEIDPIYVDVAIRRWQAFIGQAATLGSDGATFASIEVARSEALRPDPAETPAPKAPNGRASKARNAKG